LPGFFFSSAKGISSPSFFWRSEQLQLPPFGFDLGLDIPYLERVPAHGVSYPGCGLIVFLNDHRFPQKQLKDIHLPDQSVSGGDQPEEHDKRLFAFFFYRIGRAKPSEPKSKHKTPPLFEKGVRFAVYL